MGVTHQNGCQCGACNRIRTGDIQRTREAADKARQQREADRAKGKK
jgi:hypothetical protein